MAASEVLTARHQRVLVLTDEANVTVSARGVNKKPDWLALAQYLADEKEGRRLIEMVLYVGLPPSNMPEFQAIRDKKLKFVYWLKTHGFLVVTKDGSPREIGGSEAPQYKANVDVLMAIDALDLASSIQPDIVVLVTGDSDFAYLAQKLRRRGIRVEVASLDQALGNELRAAANGIIDLRKVFNRFSDLRPNGPNRIGGDDVFDE
jgi:uncharacterized LabA/DUF88 family protein